MTTNGLDDYAKLIRRIRRAVRKVVPARSKVLVVSKGDEKLLSFQAREAWHFPRSEDGMYPGYHPQDSTSAIAHLEELREKGAGFLLLPSTSLWWLDHYLEFRLHLETNYSVVHFEDKTCLIFGLDGTKAQDLAAQYMAYSRHTEQLEQTKRLLRYGEIVPHLRDLFDYDHYCRQVGRAFPSVDCALLHYIEEGYVDGYDPHPLFDTSYYLDEYPFVRTLGANPLMHYLSQGTRRELNPHPAFDTAFYYQQAPELREQNVNALLHYLGADPPAKAARPNPLFSNSYYIQEYPDVALAGIAPLLHYVRSGRAEARSPSAIQRSIVNGLLMATRRHLLRGKWSNGAVLILGRGGEYDLSHITMLAEELSDEFHLSPTVVLLNRPDNPALLEKLHHVIVLQDLQNACDILRPSALYMLFDTLQMLKPVIAFSELPEMLPIIKSHEIPTYLLCTAEVSAECLVNVKEKAPARLVFTSGEQLQVGANALGNSPTNFEIQKPKRNGYARSLLDIAAREGRLPSSLANGSLNRDRETTNKIFVPCSGWGLSGVNSSLEAIGRELIKLGWDLEIVFTRGEAATLASAGGRDKLPKLPFRYLEPILPGIQGIWAALMSLLEKSAPCIMFMAYDFTANSVAAALTEKVGVIAWMQSDDRDYYEQAYRIGRYCNALVCVSQKIRAGVAELNPGIGEKCRVIHNSTISEKHIRRDTAPDDGKIRLIYTGRLVQYQKRILDFIELANALSRAGADYQMTLVGAFERHEPTEQTFHAMAREHLESGRIRLLGRMSRTRLLRELDKNQIFVLLSDFEGLPLSLIEAMGRGCVPVVAQMESGIPEVITNGKNGVIVETRDYDEWARLLAGLWRNPKMRLQLSRAARETVRARFTLEQVVKQFDALFRKVAGDACSHDYRRPPALNWGPHRSKTGDVLPSPNMYGSNLGLLSLF